MSGYTTGLVLGRLTRSPHHVRKDEEPVILPIAVDFQDGTDFLDVETYDALATWCRDQLVTGDQLVVEGRLRPAELLEPGARPGKVRQRRALRLVASSVTLAGPSPRRSS